VVPLRARDRFSLALVTQSLIFISPARKGTQRFITPPHIMPGFATLKQVKNMKEGSKE